MLYVLAELIYYQLVVIEPLDLSKFLLIRFDDLLVLLDDLLVAFLHFYELVHQALLAAVLAALLALFLEVPLANFALHPRLLANYLMLADFRQDVLLEAKPAGHISELALYR